MNKPRSGEATAAPFRTQRFLCINGVWYFQTRGGGQKGPYSNKREMEEELSQFIREQSGKTSSMAS